MAKREGSKDFQMETIKILKPVDTDKGKELAIVRWIVDGRAWSPQLVCREIYVDRIDHKRKIGKVKGISLGDWLFLTTPERMAEITRLLKDAVYENRPAPRDSKAAASGEDVGDAIEREEPPAEDLFV